jgi:hypothetical protein
MRIGDLKNGFLYSIIKQDMDKNKDSDISHLIQVF